MKEFSSVCPNCGSDLYFNPKTGSLTCKYCESNFYLPSSSKKAIIVRQYSPGFHPSVLNKSLNSYKCKACSRVYFMTTEGRSSKCPNCGSSDIELTEEPGFCADGVIPFQITKEEASLAMQRYLDKNIKIPRELRQMAKNQKLMSVLIPVWNFSFNLYANYTANETLLHKDSYGMYYSVNNPIFGDKDKRVASIDECATDGEERIFLELFDERDYAQIVPYCPEYAFGARVDPITKDIHRFYDDVIERAEKAFKKEITRELLARKNSTHEINVSCRADDIFFNFTYVPVYVNVFNYKKKIHKIYISGTTGKVVGKPPTSTWYKFKKFFQILGVGALLALVYTLFKK